MLEEWISLSKAARMLGVHPSTVRSWADHGRLPYHRTDGGHRRFAQADIQLWLDSRTAESPAQAENVIQRALRQTRFQVSEGRLQNEQWYQKLDETAREQYRRSGRALLQGAMSSHSANEQEMNTEARALGYEYAAIGNRYNLNMSEAVSAFLFFRNVLIDSLLAVYESASPHTLQALESHLHRIIAFTDQILVTLVDTYEAYTRRSGKS